MGDASYNQPAFTGGEWSPNAQGRIDDKRYRTAMNVCLNVIPVEEGAAPRRPGTAFICTTREGLKGRILPFDFTDAAVFTMELTDSHLRFLAGRGLVFDGVQTVTDVSAGNPALVTVPSTANWSTGDTVQFLFQSTTSAATGAILRNRQLKITVINGSQFTMADPVTGDVVDGADVNWDPAQVQAQVARVLDLVTPYSSAEIDAVRRVQAGGVGINSASIAVLLHENHAPETVIAELNESSPDFTTFTISPLAFIDGPYLDIPVGATITPNQTASPFTFTIGYATWVSTTAYNIGDFVSFGGSAYQSRTEGNLNHQPDVSPTQWEAVSSGAAVGRNGLVAHDVGRLVRLLSEPAAWNSGTGYTAGQAVTYNASYYVCQVANTGQEPDLNIEDWLPTTAASVAQWVWGRISAVSAANAGTITLMGEQQTLLYNLPIQSVRFGVYADSVGWPTCGAYYEGRLWLGGNAVPNRFDASKSNDPFNFAPTAADGTVGDANAIAGVFNADDQNSLYWMEPTASGMLCGTKKGEWLIQASNLKDPITPTSIQADRVTKVGASNQLPVHTELTLVFVQRFDRMLFEAFPDLYSGKVTAPNLNVYSKHLTTQGVQELAYQSELAPIIWARMADGSFKGWTYRRKTAHSAAEPDIVGGHRHALGGGRTVVSICANGTPSQTSDSLMLVTVDANDGVYHVEQMTRMLDPSDNQFAAWYVDDAVTPSGLVASDTGITFYGLWHLNGKTVSAVCGGLDLGDYEVSDGSIFVPYQSDPGKAFTLAYLQSLDASTYGDLAVTLNASATVTPAITTTPAVINQLSLPNDHVTGASAVVAVPDYDANVVYLLANDGLRKISLTNFSQLSSATFAEIAATNVNGYYPDTVTAFTKGGDGYIYAAAVGSNQSPWIKIRASDWTVVASFGTNSNFWSQGPTGLGRPFVIMQLFGGQNYVAAGVMTGAYARAIAWMNADTFTFIGESNGFQYNIESGFGVTGVAGPSGAKGATAYFFSTPETLNFFPSHTTFYTSTMDQFGLQANTVVTKVINASDIDPTWLGITNISVGRDQRDGNLLLAVTGSDTSLFGPYTSRLVKITTDGTILWNTLVAALPNAMSISRAEHGVLSYMGEGAGPGLLRYIYVFNLTDGSYTKYTVDGMVPFGLHISDDSNGTLLTYQQYARGAGGSRTPVPGPTSASTWEGWSLLTIGNIFYGDTTTTQSDTIPAVIGFTYTSQGQIVRPAQHGETGAQTGPGHGKTRRNHMVSFLLSAGVYGTMSVGTVLVPAKMRPALFKQPNGDAYATTDLFSGVYWHTIEDNYSFDGMIAWEITRPLPCTVVSITGFLHTQDR